jgi:carboxyl-terminal processing protease
VTEADLSGHLDNANGNGDSKRKTRELSSELLSSDNQLYEALTLLKGINVLGMWDETPRANLAARTAEES